MRVAYFGFHHEPSGYGVATGMHVRALRNAGAEVRTYFAGQPLSTGANHADVAVIQVPVDRLTSSLPAARAIAPKVVLFSVWETPALPTGWAEVARNADSIWVPSRVAYRAFQSVPRPLDVVPHPIAIRTPPRRAFPGIRDTDMVFFAALEWQGRKNPQNLLRAFARAFRGRHDVVLVLKLGFLVEHDAGRILAQIDKLVGTGMPRVVVLVDTLSRRLLMRVLSRADAVISLHRAEGFGLVVAEASARSIPVICSATGGPLDYLEADAAYFVPGVSCLVGRQQRHPFEPSMQWFEPDIDAAMDAMRACASDPAGRRQRGARAQALVQERLDPARVGEMMRRLLEV